jgi:membrane protease YdiL (CAAX protease family)
MTAKDRLAYALVHHRGAKVAEILTAFGLPLTLLLITAPLAGGDPLRFQVLVWIANVLMLTLIWLGLRLRGQGWSHLGLSLTRPTGTAVARAVGTSVVVFVLAVLAFLVGAVLAANLFGMPAGADTSEYAYMQGNLPMLLGALVAAWIVSSLGEEVVYRGFLITRTTELSARPPRWTFPVLLSAVIFGLAHFSWGPTGIVQTGFMGLALGIAYVRTDRRLWPLVLAHAYMDTLLFVQMYLGA